MKAIYSMISYPLYSTYVHLYETETPISLPPEFCKEKMIRKESITQIPLTHFYYIVLETL